MDADKLKGRLREKGLSQREAARKTGVSLSRFNAKLNERDGAEFTLGELKALRSLLGLTARQVEEIFFQEKVS